MTGPAEMLTAALGHHQAGRLDEAEALYLRVLGAVPGQPDASYFLGALLVQTGRPAAALERYADALRARPGNPELLFNAGVALDAAGRAAEAADHYRRSLAARPGFVPALNNLGLALCRLGRPAEAAAILRDAVSAAPDNAELWANLGTALRAAGDPEGAAEALSQAAGLAPGRTDLLEALAAALAGLGRNAEAAEVSRRCLALAPGNARAHYNLAVALEAAGGTAAAEESYRAAAALAPDLAEAHYNLGNLLAARGEAEAALDAYGRALAARPDYVDCLNNRGRFLGGIGRLEEAMLDLDRAVSLAPTDAVARMNRGDVRLRRGDREGGFADLRKAVALEPASVKPRTSLAMALTQAGLLAEAGAVLQEALAIDPRNPVALSLLGVVLTLGGATAAARPLLEEAVRLAPGMPEVVGNYGMFLIRNGDGAAALPWLRRARELGPGNEQVHGGLIFALDFDPAVDVAEAQAERRRWYDAHCRGLSPGRGSHANPSDPERKLRVGYVSADFRQHSAAYCFRPVLDRHDRSRFEVHCYSSTPAEDGMTEAFRAAADGWRDVGPVDDGVLADIVRGDGIDILVDLSGHTAGNRLRAFARKPAPVQVSAWGHVTGTGIPEIDALFADPVLIPEEERPLFAERVVDLPCALCLDPPAEASGIDLDSAVAPASFTFGCLNRLSKVSDGTLRLWAGLLGRVPGSTLLLKDPVLDDAASRGHHVARAVAAGIDPDRLVLRGRTSRRDHLASYLDVAVALDPLSYGGGVTTFEALWMGTPVVTLPLRTLASRTAASILTACGLDGCIAGDVRGYVDVAAALAADPARIAPSRAEMRRRLSRTAPFDPAAYTRAVEGTYRSLWRDWCAARRSQGA